MIYYIYEELFTEGGLSDTDVEAYKKRLQEAFKKLYLPVTPKIEVANSARNNMIEAETTEEKLLAEYLQFNNVLFDVDIAEFKKALDEKSDEELYGEDE